jgi:uncharacterized protein (TIGR03435 family)
MMIGVKKRSMPPLHALHLLRRSLPLAAASFTLVCSMAVAQTTTAPSAAPPASPTPTYDVATIKPHQGIFQMTGIEYQPDGFAGTVTLSTLVQYAFGLRSVDQVSGAPDWAKSDWFDVQAKMSEAGVAGMQKLSTAERNAYRKLMLQAFLADRFRLTVHSATKQDPIYDLVIARGDPKLKDAATDASDQLKRGEDGKPLRGFLSWVTGKAIAQGYSMKNLADFLSQPMAGLGRPVIDKTGLTGTYNFILDWTPPHPGVRFGAESDSASPEEAPSIFTALGDIGLKLQPSTGPIDTVVIDHVERPSEN